ncbi:hypothetical protein UFOVP1636_188 [uncultured Caudovirales phage]|uniref:Uncharacterized protein n=1 Tax=uncultured Caudovirales phage TaxID=2100421 RepID=A0A6J5T084_9CAUD|nr:hypothetical protein UFOVP1636_188 [uncultured Caudovirales phage]
MALEREDLPDLARLIVEALQSGITTRTNAEDAKRAAEANAALMSLSKTIKQTTKDTGYFSKFLTNQQVPYQNVTEELKKLDEQISKSTSKSQKDNLMWEKSQITKAVSEANTKAAMTNFALGLTKTTVALGQIAAGGIGSLIKNLQGGASSIDVAAGILSSGVDVANSGMQAAAGGAQAFGTMLLSGPTPQLKLFGAGLFAAGTALSFFSASASKLAKFGIEVLSAELKKSAESFMIMGASGALFANGVQGMRDASLAAGLTVNQFSKVVQENSSTLSASGLSVSGAIKKLGGALKAGGDAMQLNLLKLGYSLEEQAGLVADTMKDLRGQGAGGLKATDTQIAEQTQKYAENLRVIAAITGEDARKKSAMVREQSNQLAFQQQLASKTPTQQAAVKRAMDNMTDIERKNFMDMVNFGSVINKEGAILEAQIPALGKSVREMFQAYNSNTLDAEPLRAIQARNNEEQRKQLLGATGIAAADAAGVGGPGGTAGANATKMLQDVLKRTPEAIKAAEDAAKAQAKTKDPLTDDLMKALQASQKMALDLQSAMDPLIKGYASVTAAMLEEIKKVFSEIAKEIGSKDTKDKKEADTAKLDAQDSKNWDKMKWYEKANSGAARGIESAGNATNFLTFGLVDYVTKKLTGNTVEDAKAERIKEETRILEQRGREERRRSDAPSYRGSTKPESDSGILGGIVDFFSSPKNTRLDGTGKRYGAAAEPSNKILLVHRGERVLNELETDEYNKGLNAATPSMSAPLANEQGQTPFKEFFVSLSAAGTSLQTLLSSGANKLADILNKDINVKVESLMPPGFSDFAPQIKNIFDQMNSAEMSRSNNADVTKAAIDQLTTIGKSMDQQSTGQTTQLQGLVSQLIDAIKLPNVQFADQAGEIKTSIDQLIAAVKLPDGQNTQFADQANLIKNSMDQLSGAVNAPNAQFANQASEIKTLITQLIGSVNTPNAQFADQAGQIKTSIDQLTTAVKLPDGQDKQFADQASQIKTSIDQLIGSANAPGVQVASQVVQIKTSIDQLISSVKTPNAQFTDQAAQLTASIDQMANAVKLPTAQFANQTGQLKTSIDQMSSDIKSPTVQFADQVGQLKTSIDQMSGSIKLPTAQFADQTEQLKTSIDQLSSDIKLPTAQFANQTEQLKTSIDQMSGVIKAPTEQFADQTGQLKTSIDQMSGATKLPAAQFAEQTVQLKTSIDSMSEAIKAPDTQFTNQTEQLKASINQMTGAIKTPDAQFADQTGQLKTSIEQMSSAIKLPDSQFTDQVGRLTSSIDTFGNNTKADGTQSTTLMSTMQNMLSQLLNFGSTSNKQSIDQSTQFQTLTDKMFNSVTTNQSDSSSTTMQKTFDQMLALGASTDKNTSQLLLTNLDSTNQIDKSFDSMSKSLIVDSNQQLDNALSNMVSELREKNVQAEKTSQVQPKSLTNEPVTAPIGSDQQQLLELVSKQLLALETNISKTDNLINLLAEGNNNTRQLLNAAY